MNADKITFWEGLEIYIYKMVSVIPVLVTFGVFLFLFVYYIYCYIQPTLKGDFFNTIGIPDMWLNEEELMASQANAKILLAIFLWCSMMLVVSIVLTISTEPGYIPEVIEWDIPESDDAKVL